MVDEDEMKASYDFGLNISSAFGMSGAVKKISYSNLSNQKSKLEEMTETAAKSALTGDYSVFSEYEEDDADSVDKIIYVIGMEDDVRTALVDYSWPGNVRALQNIIEYSINMSISNLLTLDIIPNNIKYKYYDNKSHKEEISTLADLEKEEIIKALNKFKNYKKDKDLVAKALGISRATLYRKLEKYNLVSK